MNCPKCGAQLYDESKSCLTCGYSEVKEQREALRQKALVTVSNIPAVNSLYETIFGKTDKRIVKRAAFYLILMFSIPFFIYHFFFYIDTPNGCFVTLRPALLEFSNTSVKKGILYLKENFPTQYKDFCANVHTISPNVSCGGLGGGCFWEDSPGTIYVSTTYGEYIDAAKVIIHETCHAIQRNEGRPGEETECYKKDSVIPWHYGR